MAGSFQKRYSKLELVSLVLSYLAWRLLPKLSNPYDDWAAGGVMNSNVVAKASSLPSPRIGRSIIIILSNASIR